MRCTECGSSESKVVDSRGSEDGLSIRRRRECLGCGHRFTTYERLEETPLIVIKNDGSSEEYDRDKLFRGLLIACAKRPVPPETLSEIIDDIELELRTYNKTQISSKELGDLVLARISRVDIVAYIRFASVYKDFKSVDEFYQALQELE